MTSTGSLVSHKEPVVFLCSNDYDLAFEYSETSLDLLHVFGFCQIQTWILP